MTVRTAIRSAIGLLSRRDRRLLAVAVIIQMATSALDLLGVLLIGLVAAISVTTVQSQPAPSSVTAVADFFGLGELDSEQLVLVLAAAAAIVLLTKSLVSSLLTRRVFMFLANRQALVSARLSKELLSRPLTFVESRSSQETAFALITGAGAATSMILGQLVIAATEVALLLVLAGALLFLSPWVAVGAICFFTLVAIALQWAMGGWATRVGQTAARADILSLNTIQEAIGAYREISVSDRREFYVERIQNSRWEAARVAADAQFIGMFPKYMFEGALVLGGFALAGVLFATQDSVTAVGTLALFLAAGTRVMPSLLRLQSAALGLRSSAGVAGPTFTLANELGNPLVQPGPPPSFAPLNAAIRRGHPDLDPTINLSEISFTYPGAEQPALHGVSFRVAAGTSVALTGRSGAGKSTLADVILGVLTPDCGEVLVGDLNPTLCIQRFPGSVAYVPQDVMLANASIRANVALGLPDEAIDDESVWDALRRAHLADYLHEARDGLETLVGERGVRLSGGQRQRLGIARALYTRPRILVLDEATSALDAETERSISQMIGELEGEVTLIVIAHRLSTVRDLDQLVYLEDGQVLARGRFEDVVTTVPAFRRQAAMMGLAP